MNRARRTKSIALAAAAAALALASTPISAAGERPEPNGDANRIAIGHVRSEARTLGVTPADVRELAIASSYPSRHTGVTHVNLNQLHAGLEIFGALATVNVSPDGSILFVGDTLVAEVASGTSGQTSLTAIEAVGAASESLGLAPPRGLSVLRREPGPARETLLSHGGISEAPIPVRLGWQPTERGLRLAWQLVIDDATSVDMWNATIDAETGALIDLDNWTSHASPNPVSDGSSYRVFALPKESPNDGGRTLVANPADATASPFGWHDTDGTLAPNFTITRGNNVHAYTDRDNNNAEDVGGEPSGGPGLDFDFPADLADHATSYTDAATANLFYWNNVTHDVLHRYGFDEPSGNFQVNNYGRGGVGNDDVRAEAQDGGGTNNANFSTPAQDGGRPRMQMYLWPGAQFGSPNAVTIETGSAAGAYNANFARFSPGPTNAGISGNIVQPNATLPVLNDGCTPYSVPAGSIVLVDNSALCNHRDRATNAQSSGAAAMVVAHNAAGAAPILSAAMTAVTTIPVVSISQADGLTIKAGLPASGRVHKRSAHPGIRDGDFESGIVIHEYGHGVSNRLTGGPTINCLSGNEQMGEGWSDYLAISMLLDPALDNPEGPRGMGPYALFQDSRQGNGIRPRPYSRNMQIQPFTYDSIKTGGWLNGASLSVPHGIGHGWAAVMWDMMWDLIDRHGLNPNVYGSWQTGGNNLAIQLVIDGMKLQGCGPGFVRGRAAIVEADQALTGGKNACTLWASFSRRGLGYSAVQGTTARDDNLEAFDTHPTCRRAFASPTLDQPELNEVVSGDTVPMRFSLGGNKGLNILASNSPFTRKVDCMTKRVPSEGTFITPRERPVPTSPAGRSGLSYSPGTDRYHYNWKTEAGWADTCRELVLTLKDGIQYRAYFRFTSA